MADHQIYAGPGVVTFNPNGLGAHDYYTDPSGIEIIYERNLFTPETANWGAMGARHQGTLTKIRFTPAGHLTAALLAKFWPYDQTVIGKLCKTTLGASCVVKPYPANGTKMITYAKGCITALPSLKLSANSLAFSGKMEITCWGNPSKNLAEANYWQTSAVATAPAATVISEANFPSPRVAVTYGSIFGMEVDSDGVMVDFNLSTGSDLVSNYRGPLDKAITSLGIQASFTPIGLGSGTWDEDAYHAMLALDGTSAARPGDTVGVDGVDLEITCTGTSASMTTLTLVNMGPGPGALNFSANRWRQGQVVFHSKPLFSTGVPQPMFTAA